MAVIQTSQMANGLTIASVAMPASHSVSLGVWVKAGARDERGDEIGIAHFLEHMAFKRDKEPNCPFHSQGCRGCWRLYQRPYRQRGNGLLYPSAAGISGNGI